MFVTREVYVTGHRIVQLDGTGRNQMKAASYLWQHHQMFSTEKKIRVKVTSPDGSNQVKILVNVNRW
jgi:hypothetical protein